MYSRLRLPKRLRKKRGLKVDPLAEENAALRQRIDWLEAVLKRAETIIEDQKSHGEARSVSAEHPEERRDQMKSLSDLTSQTGVAVAVPRHWQFHVADSIGAGKTWAHPRPIRAHASSMTIRIPSRSSRP